MTATPPPDYHHTFALRGGGYDDAMRRWPQARDEEFRFAVELADLRGPCRLLDVPAGGGYLADHLPPGVQYLALEHAPSFAARCRDRGLPVIEGDLRATTVAADSADAIVSLAGLHHEQDLAEVLIAWRRVLRPGGRLVIADVTRGSEVATFLDGFVGRHNAVGHDGVFLGPEVGEVVAGAGYVDVEVTAGRYHWWFDDEESLGRYCIGLFGLVGPSWSEVVEAARTGPGIDVGDDGRVGLRWGLCGVAATAPSA